MLSQAQITGAAPEVFLRADIAGLGERHEGKVRDFYQRDGRRILITTDRVSAFDRVVGAVPYKGQVLNQLSAWWFEQLAGVVPSHVISVPDPNVTIAQEAIALPVEVVVRGYITGSTSTALWTLYNQGMERPYGLELPKGLKKNDPLPEPAITPTTKAGAGEHDERLTEAEVIARGLVGPVLWEQVRRAALTAFERGQERARAAGLVLVDTKYEFGTVGGALVLIDEVHTPDCSRFWSAASLQQGTEPESFDKEHLRLWFAAQGYRGEGAPPALPAEFVANLAARYIYVYEKLTGRDFVPAALPAAPRIATALEYLR